MKFLISSLKILKEELKKIIKTKSIEEEEINIEISKVNYFYLLKFRNLNLILEIKK